MRVFHALPNPPLTQPTSLAIGNFDGVHLGHQTLLRAMVADARSQERAAGVLTFDPHPMAVLRPGFLRYYLTTVPERLQVLATLGLDFAVVLPFTREMSQMPAAEFVAHLHKAVHLAALWVGPDFALGRGREGNVDVLRAIGRSAGFEVHVIDPQVIQEDEVRSGRIRSHLLNGEVEAAGQMLGRLYRVTGMVVPGAHRGRLLGFPTANLAVDEGRLLPGNGVYATWVLLDDDPLMAGRRLASVTNIGVRPSFDNGQRTVEAHVLDFAGDLYGRRLTLEFVARLRPEMRFDGVDALRAQIASDVETARRILTATGRP